MYRPAESLRKLLFWALDMLKGGPVYQHYRDICFVLENFDSPVSLKRRKQLMTELLDHAVETTTFYARYKGYNDLQSFPVIDKALLRERFKEFRSKAYPESRCFGMTTSGSSGTPFTTMQNKTKKNRNTADTIYFKKQAGYEVGYRLFYVRRWFAMHQRGLWVRKFQNIREIEVTSFSDDYLQGWMAEMERERSNFVIIAYVSALMELLDFIERSGSPVFQANLKCIIAVGEGMSEESKEKLRRYFNVPVLQRYSNHENGILSLQFPDVPQLYQVNWASFHIEILHPDRDVPVARGDLGRVVVTDFFNHAMPLIRYDTGDLAVMTDDNPGFNGAPALSHVAGRQMDVLLDTSGNRVSPYIVFHLEEFPEIRQFQLVQTGPGTYVFRLNLKKPFRRQAAVVSIFREYLGEDADFAFHYVDEIPQLASGKRKLIINEFRPSPEVAERAEAVRRANLALDDSSRPDQVADTGKVDVIRS